MKKKATTCYPHPELLLREINEVLAGDMPDDFEVTVEQGILRRACWHLGRFRAMQKEQEEAATRTKIENVKTAWREGPV